MRNGIGGGTKGGSSTDIEQDYPGISVGNPHPIGDPNFCVSLPKAAMILACPLGGCHGRAMSQTNIQVHFVNCHVRDIIVIMEEGNHPHPLVPGHNMFYP